MTINLLTPENKLKEKFFNMQSPEDVADLLELSSYSFLEYTIFVLPTSKKYERFFIPKKRGGQRIIQEPIPNLKIIQHKLLQVLKLVYKPKGSVHGFVNHRSIVSNAEQHVKRRHVLNIDLENFFPSIHFGRVRGMFMTCPYNLNPELATVLAQICSLPTGLPQGAPTSPIISNMLCAKLDSHLKKLAKTHHCYYTRYADDLTFSTSRRNFPATLAVLVSDEVERHVIVGDDLRLIIHENGFKINKEKTRLQSKDKRQEVTGLVTNKFVNVNRRFIRQIRAMLHAWRKYGYEAAENEYRQNYCHKTPDKPYKIESSFRHVVKGKIGFLGMVRGETDKIFIRLNNQAAQLEQDTGFENPIFRILEGSNIEILDLIAQGETNQVEFKVGACVNPHTNQPDKRNMSEKVLKEVAAFLNSNTTGTVLIGVRDDGHLLGIEREYATADPHKPNWDGYELFLTSLFNDSLGGTTLNAFYNISQQQIDGKTICVIRTTPSDEWVFAKDKFFIRSGTQSKELKGYEMAEYIKSKKTEI